MAQRAEILRQLQQHQAEIRQAFGVERLGLFGSAARDELREDSDVDVLVAFRETVTFTAYLGLKRYLEALLHRPVDLVTETGLKPRARPYVEQDLIQGHSVLAGMAKLSETIGESSR
jgi:predicted nucleotidyltransferase